MGREHALKKIKLLLKLCESPNTHEAETAKQLAEKLIAKYNVAPEELGDVQGEPQYDDEEKLYSTIGLVSWRQQLAVVIVKYFDCQIVQVELVPAEGPHQFDYFIYGDPQDTQTVSFVFKAFSGKVEQLITTQCIDRGPIYIDSYCEGVTDAIKQNIWTDGIHLPEKQVPVRAIPTPDNADTKADQITKPKEDKVRADKHVDVRSQSMVKDIMAYFKGIEDGKSLSLSDVLETADQNGTDC